MIHRSWEIEQPPRRLVCPGNDPTLDPAAAAVWGNDVRTDIGSLALAIVSSALRQPPSLHLYTSPPPPPRVPGLTGFARMISRARTHAYARRHVVKSTGMAGHDAPARLATMLTIITASTLRVQRNETNTGICKTLGHEQEEEG